MRVILLFLSYVIILPGDNRPYFHKDSNYSIKKNLRERIYFGSLTDHRGGSVRAEEVKKQQALEADAQPTFSFIFSPRS